MARQKKPKATKAKKLTQKQMESSIPGALERLKDATHVTDWIYNPKTRGFESTRFIMTPEAKALGIKKGETGAKISRRQFDKNFGLLAKQGFTSYEQKKTVRRNTGLTGFKSKGKFAAYPMRRFDSQYELILWLEAYEGDKTFRVLLHGIVRKGTTHGTGAIEWRFGNQLAPMIAADFLEKLESGEIESDFEDVLSWTLVVYPANGEKPKDHSKALKKK